MRAVSVSQVFVVLVLLKVVSPGLVHGAPLYRYHGDIVIYFHCSPISFLLMSSIILNNSAADSERKWWECGTS